METTHRAIYEIANDIRRDWGKNISFYAKPYLDAMLCLEKASDKYGLDSASSIVLYFLSNAVMYRGENARKYKAELRAIVKTK
jgi:hypothetical protein